MVKLELNLDVSKRFMVLVSVVLIFGTVASVGFAGEGHFNLPLAWVLDKDGNSVDADGDGIVDNSEKVDGLSASDLMAGGATGDNIVTFEKIAYTNGGNPNFCLKYEENGQGVFVNDGLVCDVGKICDSGECINGVLPAFVYYHNPTMNGYRIKDDLFKNTRNSADMFCIEHGYAGHSKVSTYKIPKGSSYTFFDTTANTWLIDSTSANYAIVYNLIVCENN